MKIKFDVIGTNPTPASNIEIWTGSTSLNAKHVTLATGFTRSSDGISTFNAPDGTVLQPDTDYILFIDVTGSTGSGGMQGTASTNQSGLTGWTIADTVRRRDFNTTGISLTASSGIVMKMELVGYANNVPMVANPIPDQTARVGTAFSYTFPANTFADADGHFLLYFTVVGLPSWLTFDGGTRTFSGTPAAGDAGIVTVRVAASDGLASVIDDFDIVVRHLERELEPERRLRGNVECSTLPSRSGFWYVYGKGWGTGGFRAT